MRFQEFVEKVREKAGLESDRESRQVVEATLETLGERLHRTERAKLGAQLPEEFKHLLDRRGGHNFFSLEEFYNRVSARSGLGYPAAVAGALAVAAVLQEAVSPGEFTDVFADLTEEYRELFGQKEVGPLSPSSV